MIRYKFLIKGQVQGVGFRPFIYKLAISLNLCGFVQNSSGEVIVEIEGGEQEIRDFKQSLILNLPPLARVDEVKEIEMKPLYERCFEIVKSNNSRVKTALISPDIAICDECLLDINLNFQKKYFHYFAINCTNCGPRFSIIETIPYDRLNTSMAKFKMCKSCGDEYENPLNRRYHAQPIGCKECGVKLELRVKNKELVVGDEEKFRIIAKLINSGKIGAIKGVGGFHLVCDSRDEEVIKRLRGYKNRPTKPFAIMCRDLEQIKTFTKLSIKEEELLSSKEAPIVIVRKIQNSLIAPNIDKIGCFLPYTALHHLLFNYLENPIIATSANLGDEPVIIRVEDIEEKLPFVDFILDYNRDIVNGVDDSLVQVVDNKIQILRLARGFAPRVIKLPFKIDKKILAVGANQKNSIALAFEDNIILSPHIGDLDSIKSFEFFQRMVKTFEKFYDFKPDIIICDKHPNYQTTKWAKEFKELKIVEVQHHIAHLYCVLAEYNLTSNSYISFIFDGSGFGDDGTLWGGEIFLGDERKYHFKPIKLIGGEVAIKEPRRVALGMVFEKYGFDLVKIREFNFGFTEIELKILYQSWGKSLNSPLSSSVGRLFDSVASFAGLIQVQSYEGEAGLMCEMAYDKNIKTAFEYKIKNSVIEIDFDFLDKDIVTKFINTLVQIIVDIAKKEDKKVILSGGVFQNKTLLELTIYSLKKQNLEFFYNRTIPINDGGIALGQVWYACAKIKN